MAKTPRIQRTKTAGIPGAGRGPRKKPAKGVVRALLELEGTVKQATVPKGMRIPLAGDPPLATSSTPGADGDAPPPSRNPDAALVRELVNALWAARKRVATALEAGQSDALDRIQRKLDWHWQRLEGYGVRVDEPAVGSRWEVGMPFKARYEPGSADPVERVSQVECPTIILRDSQLQLGEVVVAQPAPTSGEPTTSS